MSGTSTVKGLRREGIRTTQVTIDDYLSAFCEAFLLYAVPRYDVKGRSYLKTLGKYYVSDLGLRFALLGSRGGDAGHLLGNAVFLELKKRYREVYTGRGENSEIDFVVFEEGLPRYYQVAWSIRENETLQRELRAFQSARDSYPRHLVTMDFDAAADYQGVTAHYALDFLSGIV